MMFGRINHSFHSAFFKGGDDIGGIKIRGVEDFRVFIAVTPFPSRERIQAKVDEAVEFHALPFDLGRCWNRAVWFGRCCGPAGQHGGRENCSEEECC